MIKDLIILIIGISLASILHVVGTFGYKYWKTQSNSAWFIILLGILLGSSSYVVKVPLFYYYAKQNVLSTYILSISIISIVITLFSKFILKEQIQMHTYIILLLVVILLSYNEYLNFDNKKIVPIS
jgi:hypothetical protein